MGWGTPESKILLDCLCGKRETELIKGMLRDCLVVLRLETVNFYWHISAWFCDFPQLRLAACVSETKRRIVGWWRRQKKQEGVAAMGPRTRARIHESVVSQEMGG